MIDVLVVAPHPDDEVLGCGGSILNHRAACRQVAILYLTSGERRSATLPADELRQVREQEARTAAEALGVDAGQLRFLRLPDGGVDARDPQQVGKLIRELRSVRPRLMYLPHPGEGAFDHAEAFALCWRAAGMAGSRNFPGHGENPWWVPTVLGYEVWTPLSEPQYSEDITGVLDRKLAALGCYRSQSPEAKGGAQPTYAGNSAGFLSGYRGAMTTGGHREAFHVLRLGALP